MGHRPNLRRFEAEVNIEDRFKERSITRVPRSPRELWKLIQRWWSKERLNVTIEIQVDITFSSEGPRQIGAERHT